MIVSSLVNRSPTAPANSTPDVSTLLGNGDGTFQAPISQNIEFGQFGPGYSLIPTDFNGDGKLDVVDGHITNEAFGLLFGNGDGTFVDIGTGAGGLSPFATTGLFALGDFNADENVDIALVNNASTVVIFQGDGQGAFRPAQELLSPTAFDLSHRIAVAGDFNGDGGLDLAVIQPSPPNSAGIVTVYLNDPFKSVFPTSLSFGSVGINTESNAQTITIHNPSTASFHISNISISGPFGKINNCGASLAPNATCTVTVHFSPTAEGTTSGALTLTDSTHASPQLIPLSGSGVDGPFLQLAPTRANLGSANIGSTNGPQTITLSNTGNASLTITAIAISGGDDVEFAQSNTCGSSLAVGATCNVSVTFSPLGGGTRSSSLTITDSAPGSPHGVSLTGTGPTEQGALVLSATSLTFSTQSVGTASSALSVTVTNSSNSSAPISQISATGDFKETNNCTATLNASASCQISVTFSPTAGGSRTGTLTISGAGSQTAALIGTGADFSISDSSGSGGSATVTAGATATYPISLVGGAGFGGTIALTCSGAPANSTCSISPSSVTLGGTTPATVTVSVTTTARSLFFAPPVQARDIDRWQMFALPATFVILAALLVLLLVSPRLTSRRRPAWVPMAVVLHVPATYRTRGRLRRRLERLPVEPNRRHHGGKLYHYRHRNLRIRRQRR